MNLILLNIIRGEFAPFSWKHIQFVKPIVNKKSRKERTLSACNKSLHSKFYPTIKNKIAAITKKLTILNGSSLDQPSFIT